MNLNNHNQRVNSDNKALLRRKRVSLAFWVGPNFCPSFARTPYRQLEEVIRSSASDSVFMKKISNPRSRRTVTRRIVVRVTPTEG